MEKTPHFAHKPSDKGARKKLLLDLNKFPIEISDDDVPPPPPFYIDLCFHNEDMEVLKQKYKVLSSSSSVANDDYFKSLGFQNSSKTMIHVKDKKGKIPRNSHHALGRSLFKDITKKDEGNKLDAEHLAAKILLKDFVLQAKARASAIKKKGKKKVRFDCGPLDRIWKKNFVPRKRRSGVVIIDREQNA